MKTVVSMRPDRVAVYGYAHLPETIPHQRKINTRDVPGVGQRLRLEQIARERLREAGYVEIGLDHFALPGDRLAAAAAGRSLHRDFMGYTTRRTPTLIGLTGSAGMEQRLSDQDQRITDLAQALAANCPHQLGVGKGGGRPEDAHARHHREAQVGADHHLLTAGAI